jgi:hypothetical protein
MAAPYHAGVIDRIAQARLPDSTQRSQTSTVFDKARSVMAMDLSEQKLENRVVRLETLSRAELVDRWVKAYGNPPFKGARQSTLVRGLAYHQQCKTYGGLKPSINRELHKIAAGGSIKQVEQRRKSVAPIGSQLVREWNGKTHRVVVTDKGYVLNGVTYTSLSAAARAITGAHWSGPRFFGVAS